MEQVCNYALIRFLPHRETGEFVNIGIALACGATGYLDFKMEKKRFERVTHFFPELPLPVYREGLRALEVECERWRKSAIRFQQKQPQNSEATLRHIFGELTRASESVFHFSQPRAVLANDPSAKLNELFAHYVQRQFITDEAQGEEVLRQRIAQSLRALGVSNIYYAARIGTSDYSVKFPFVSHDVKGMNPDENDEATIRWARKAIKPLNLDRRDPSEITQHGDDWIARVKRLQKIESLPEQLLFSVKEPTESGRAQAAAHDIRQELEDLGVETITTENEAALNQFVLPQASFS